MKLSKIFEISEIKKKIVNLFSARYRQLKLVEIFKNYRERRFIIQ